MERAGQIRSPVTVVVPAYNSHGTLHLVLASLERQTYTPLHIVVIDDQPAPNPCDEIIAAFKGRSKHRVTYIKRVNNKGLAAAYNEAANLAQGAHLITLQADVVIPKCDGVARLIEPLLVDPDVVLSCALQETPWSVWEEYGFWQKCLFARHVGKAESGRNGRFCCFSIKALEKIGCFDEKTYRTAGEDGDVLMRLRHIGKIVDVPIIVQHLHSMDPNFPLKSYIHKENQLAEAQGALLANHFSSYSLSELLILLARPLALISLLVPWIRVAGTSLIIIYCFLITGKVFRYVRDWRLMLLPLVNVMILVTFVFYMGRGYIRKKQTL